LLRLAGRDYALSATPTDDMILETPQKISARYLDYNCVREKMLRKRKASNVRVNERDEDNFTRSRENVRSGHIGTSGKYNGKLLGTNYTGGKRNSSASFKFIINVEELLMKLRRIRVGNEYMRVFLAFDRRNKNNMHAKGENVNGGGRGDNVAPGNPKTHKGDQEQEEKGELTNERVKEMDMIVEVREDDIEKELIRRSVVGEVKSMCFLKELPEICEEQGLSRVEVKRWIHKLRRWDRNIQSAGRFTWINIMGVPVSCWTESVFRKIAGVHGQHNGNEGKEFTVNVVEEIRDVSELIIVEKTKHEQEEQEDKMSVHMRDVNDNDKEGIEESDEEGDDGDEVKEIEKVDNSGSCRFQTTAARSEKKDEGSRVSVGL
nr:hypothetical protein [Tanacetum cinerariifolium]